MEGKNAETYMRSVEMHIIYRLLRKLRIQFVAEVQSIARIGRFHFFYQPERHCDRNLKKQSN